MIPTFPKISAEHKIFFFFWNAIEKYEVLDS